jgi:hypothetical protein
MKCASRRLAVLRLALVITLAGVPRPTARAGVLALSDERAGEAQRGKALAGFWEKKPQLIEAMREDRRIVVSSKVERTGSSDRPEDHFQIQGAGWVKASPDEAFRIAQDYARLPEISEHFQKAVWSAEKSELFLAMVALGYVTEMKLAMRSREIQSERELFFEVIEGHFLGLKGRLAFTSKMQGEVTQVALFVDHKSPELPLPRVLMGVVLEAIAEKVAQRMRRHMENRKAASSRS